jgi:hypothetical protein
MIGRRHALLSALGLLLPAAGVGASVPPSPPSGTWYASVRAHDVLVPFRLALTFRRGAAEGAFFNGDQRVRSSSRSFDGTRLVLAFERYASTLEARWA